MSRTPTTLSQAEIDATAADWVVRSESGLSAAEESEFARWKLADERHQTALDRLGRTWSLLERPRHAGRGDEMVRVLASRAKRRRRRRTATAAVALVALFVTSLTWQTSRPGQASTRATAVLVTPEKRMLPDGGTVELKPGAEIAVDYTGELRRVTLLKGEALFQVAENKNRAFVVTAGGIDVRAVGTAFLVAMGSRQIDVVVTHGRVAVEKPTPPAASPVAEKAAESSRATLVDAGSGVTVTRTVESVAPEVVAISPTELSARLAWCGPRVEFSDTPLAEAVALMNRHSTLRLVVDDGALAKLPVNGIFRADNTETLVRLLEASFGVQADRVGDIITLRKAR